MVDIMGHVAIGLLWAAPAWLAWSDRVSAVFVAFATVAALFPDVDFWIGALLPGVVQHHGVFHTVVFVAVTSLVVGAIAAATLARPIDRWLGGDRFDGRSLFVFATAAVLVGGLSHLFADVLSAPDVAQSIEPFWPLYRESLSIDLIWYDSPVWNLGLLIVAVSLHLGIAYLSDPVEHPYRLH